MTTNHTPTTATETEAFCDGCEDLTQTIKVQVEDMILDLCAMCR